MKTEHNNINVMADEKQHTKGKWKLSKYGQIYSSNDNLQIAALAGMREAKEAEANAKLIVTAVNNHYKLIEALKNVCDELKIVEQLQVNETGKTYLCLIEAKQLLQQIEQQ